MRDLVTHTGSSRCIARVISGICDFVCVPVCMSALIAVKLFEVSQGGNATFAG